MFTIEADTAEAKQYVAKVGEELSGREAEVVNDILADIKSIVGKIGGFVTVSGGGHLNSAEGRHGDKLWLSIATLPKPQTTTPGGQMPPEGNVANPIPADGSPAAKQEEVPQAMPPGSEVKAEVAP